MGQRERKKENTRLETWVVAPVPRITSFSREILKLLTPDEWSGLWVSARGEVSPQNISEPCVQYSLVQAGPDQITGFYGSNS